MLRPYVIARSNNFVTRLNEVDFNVLPISIIEFPTFDTSIVCLNTTVMTLFELREFKTKEMSFKISPYSAYTSLWLNNSAKSTDWKDMFTVLPFSETKTMTNFDTISHIVRHGVTYTPCVRMIGSGKIKVIPNIHKRYREYQLLIRKLFSFVHENFEHLRGLYPLM